MAYNLSSSLLLPAELKYQIAELLPPSSLASLARTHSAYQREAEATLYRTILICTSLKNASGCLETLSKSMEKAGLVRYLTMECAMGPDSEHRQAMVQFLKALPNMHALSDVRIKSRPSKAVNYANELNNILCDGHFELKVLYCDDDLDLPLIIQRNPSLLILGIYTDSESVPEMVVRSLRECLKTDLPLPWVFTFRPAYCHGLLDHITIFPVFYSMQQIKKALSDLSVSIEKDIGRDMDISVSICSIYLAPGTSENCRRFQQIVETMALHLPDVDWLFLHFQQQCCLSSMEMKDIFASIPNLEEFRCALWDQSEGSIDGFPVADEVCAIEKWGLACPRLNTVLLFDGKTFERKEASGTWSFVGYYV